MKKVLKWVGIVFLGLIIIGAVVGEDEDVVEEKGNEVANINKLEEKIENAKEENTKEENSKEESEKEEEISFESLLENTHIDGYKVDEETGFTIVQAKINEFFSPETSIEGFNQEMWTTLKEYHELFPNGVMYLGYGNLNGDDYYKIRAQFNGDTLKNINFDEIILESQSIIYADRYYIGGFGEINLDIPTSKNNEDFDENNPVDMLWGFETTGQKRDY